MQRRGGHRPRRRHTCPMTNLVRVNDALRLLHKTYQLSQQAISPSSAPTARHALEELGRYRPS